MTEKRKGEQFAELFLTFLKIGAFTFGGGYAMIALLEHEFVDRKNWLGKEEFTDMVAIAESTPGPVAINCATYIGHRTMGIAGAVAATCAICIPSVIIIMIVSMIYDAFLANRYVAYAFEGIRICVVYLIGSVGIKMFVGMKKSTFNICIAGCVLLLMIVTSVMAVKCSTIMIILLCGMAGIAGYGINTLRERSR